MIYDYKSRFRLYLLNDLKNNFFFLILIDINLNCFLLQPINNPKNEHLGCFIKEFFKLLTKISMEPCHTRNVPSLNDIARTLTVFYNRLINDTAHLSLDKMNSSIEFSDINPSSNDEKDSDSPSFVDVRNYDSCLISKKFYYIFFIESTVEKY